MKAPISWLTELVELPEGTTTAEVAAELTRAGLNVERIETIGGEVSGPVVVGRVLQFTPEPQKNGKVINWCRVDVGPEHNEPASTLDDGTELPAGRGIVCGAHNFAVGDLVVVALPGAELPEGFSIAARKTYGHVSDGMMCASDELGLGGDHAAGILILPEQVDGSPVLVGSDAMALLGGGDEVLEIDVTPDIGYCLSMRGIARETAQAFGVHFHDPYAPLVAPVELPAGQPVRIDSERCSSFTALTIDGIDPAAPSPEWMRQRLEKMGMRSISLPVDVTNYVMLESGQPLHAYDADKLSGEIVVRLAQPGEKLVTLDSTTRTLDADDLLITDASGPIGLAGVMGGEATEVGEGTHTIVLEAASFDALGVARTFRRHKLPSEASRRYERGTDPALTQAAAARAAELMVTHGGGRLVARTVVGQVPQMPRQVIQADLPARILGTEVSREQVIDILTASGVDVTAMGDQLTLVPPTWRPDLVDPYDYVEEVGRKTGFDRIEGIVPTAPAGYGLSAAQRGRRDVLRSVVDLGFTELISLPFVSSDEIALLAPEPDDPRRALVKLANPLDDTHAYLRSTLLPGLLQAVARNTSRSEEDLALFECGRIFGQGSPQAAPRPSVAHRPDDQELAGLERALPQQALALAGVVTGNWLPAGWNQPAVKADWTHVVAFAETAARALGVELTRRQAAVAPWHPGRCAELLANGRSIGVAGELHPSVVKAFGLPARACAVELDLGMLLDEAPAAGSISPLSSFPLAKEDVALVVDEQVGAAELRQALVEGAGELLEACELFDIYRGPQVGEGRKSLAFALHFRGADRTLKDTEAAAARDAAVALAAERFGAVQRA